jgi:ABC-type transporter Mla subunit MlaD
VNTNNSTDLSQAIQAAMGTKEAKDLLNHPDFASMMQHPDTKTLISNLNNSLNQTTNSATSAMSAAMAEAKQTLATLGHNSPDVGDIAKVAQQIFDSKQPNTKGD